MNRRESNLRNMGTHVMRTLGVIVAAIVISTASSAAHAAGLSVTMPNVTYNWAADGNPSTFIAKIEVLNPSNDPTLLGGWQLDLALQKVGGTGTLHFDDASTTALGASYVMFGNTSGLFSSVTDTSIFAFDLDPFGGPLGVPVPVSGSYFLAISFKTPDNAKGDWNLVALPGNTLWTATDQVDRYFTNVPESGDPVVLGTIHVIPEPSALALMAIGGGSLGLLVSRRRAV